MAEERKLASPDSLSAETLLHSLRQEIAQWILGIVVRVGPAVLLASLLALTSRNDYIFFLTALGSYGVLLLIYFWKIVPPGVRAGITAALWYFLAVLSALIYGWRDTDWRVYAFAFPLLMTLFFGRRDGFVALGLLLLTGIGLGVTGVSFAGVASIPSGAVVSNTVVFALVGGLTVAAVDYFVMHLQAQVARVGAFSAVLAQQQTELDQRMAAMRAANYAVQRRVMQLEAGAEVGKAIASIFDLEHLLRQSAMLVTEYYGFYHTGIFLLDEGGEWAVLKAASSEGGRKMLANAHRLRRGEGMVGWSVEHESPRIALDVGEDAVHFVNPYLPATRSEAVLPLMVGGRLIGVLDVQSTEEMAFDEDDIRSLEFLAGQLASAIQNAAFLSDEVRMLESASPFYRLAGQIARTATTRDVYTVMLEMARQYSPHQAFIFFLDREARLAEMAAELRGAQVTFATPTVEPGLAGEDFAVALGVELTELLFVDNLRELEAGGPAALHGVLTRLNARLGAHSMAFIPVRVGSRNLVLLMIAYNTYHPFSLAEKQLYRALAELASVALERMLLVEQAELRVVRERWLRDFTGAMLSSLDLQMVMAHTATALQTLVNADGVLVTIEQPQMLAESREVQG